MRFFPKLTGSGSGKGLKLLLATPELNYDSVTAKSKLHCKRKGTDSTPI